MRNQNLPVSQADIVPSILAIIGFSMVGRPVVFARIT
jgi:hypothetical protein